MSFDLEPGGLVTSRNTRENTLGFIPAVEVLNKPDSSGTSGEGEFEPFMEQIVLHDTLNTNIAKNIEFLVTQHLLVRVLVVILSKLATLIALSVQQLVVKVDLLVAIPPRHE